MTAGKQPTFFLPHGGGPCFFMEWTMGPVDTWDRMAAFLRGLVDTLPARPTAIVVLSGHWEAPAFTVSTDSNPALYFDYYGFPPHTYELRYPVPGAPALAHRIANLLGQAGLPSATESGRGLDHGVFVPFMLVAPEANIPIVQMSLKAGLDPAEHLAAGQALAPLRDENVLIAGSGMSFHNLRAYGNPSGGPPSKSFDAWLTSAVAAPPAERNAALAAWSDAPSARVAHPREEHLLPLMVAAGAAEQDQGRAIFTDQVMNVTVSGHRFG